MNNVIVCASDQVRNLIIKAVEGSTLGKEIKEATLKELKGLPGCEGALPVDFEDAKKTQAKKEGKKRGPSGYNLFVKDCVTSPELAGIEKVTDRMKECGPRWKACDDEFREKYNREARALKG